MHFFLKCLLVPAAYVSLPSAYYYNWVNFNPAELGHGAVGNPIECLLTAAGNPDEEIGFEGSLFFRIVNASPESRSNVIAPHLDPSRTFVTVAPCTVHSTRTVGKAVQHIVHETTDLVTLDLRFLVLEMDRTVSQLYRWQMVNCRATMRPKEASRLCLLYTSPSPRDQRGSRMPSSA